MKVHLMLKNLRISVKDNSSAYAFSLTITGSYSILTSISQPRPYDIFAGAAGAVCAFMLAELVTLFFLGNLDEGESARTRVLGRMMSVISVGCGMGTAYLCAILLSGWVSWLAAGFASSLVFVLLEGLELALAEDCEKKS